MQREIRIVLERSNPLLTSLDARVALLKVEEEKKILYIGELHEYLQTVTSVFVSTLCDVDLHDIHIQHGNSTIVQQTVEDSVGGYSNEERN